MSSSDLSDEDHKSGELVSDLLYEESTDPFDSDDEGASNVTTANRDNSNDSKPTKIDSDAKHLNTTTKKKLGLLTCRYCGDRFKSGSTLRSHAKKCKDYHSKCIYCKKEFQSVKELTTHLRVHTGDKPFTCGVCHRRFTQSSNLYRHMDTHTVKVDNKKKKEYRCEVCGQVFKQALHVTRHMTTHTGKTILCDICGKSFVDKFCLERHAAIHSNIKPFTCGQCGAGFNRKESLKCHEKNKHRLVKRR